MSNHSFLWPECSLQVSTIPNTQSHVKTNPQTNKKKWTRCPGGSCQLDASLCPNVTQCTTSGEQLCMDGMCRPACPRYDGCNSTTNPYLCSNFICAANASACHQCGNSSTELCWDGACACTYVPSLPQIIVHFLVYFVIQSNFQSLFTKTPPQVYKSFVYLCFVFDRSILQCSNGNANPHPS